MSYIKTILKDMKYQIHTNRGSAPSGPIAPVLLRPVVQKQVNFNPELVLDLGQNL